MGEWIRGVGGLSGFGGPGTCNIEPNRRAFLRLDGDAIQLKVCKPGMLTNKTLYKVPLVKRGENVSLRSHDFEIL